MTHSEILAILEHCIGIFLTSKTVGFSSVFSLLKEWRHFVTIMLLQSSPQEDACIHNYANYFLVEFKKDIINF